MNDEIILSLLSKEQKERLATRTFERTLEAIEDIDFVDMITDNIENSFDFSEIIFEYLDGEKLGKEINRIIQKAFKEHVK